MIRTAFIIILITLPNYIYANVSRDTIRLRNTDVMEYNNILYFGIKDSIILIPHGSEYKLFRNRLVLENGIKKNSKAALAANYIYQQYLGILRNQLISATPPTDFIFADSLFSIFDGKIIRNIRFVSVDIIDGSVYDTLIQNNTAFGNVIEKTHISTRKKIIAQNLKFKKNDIVNSRIIADNERLLRNLPYIEDAKIILTPVNYLSDSVDATIITKDYYHIAANFELLDYNYFIINPYSVNFLGSGNHLGAIYMFNNNGNPPHGYGANYLINNILHSFTSSEVKVLRTFKEEYVTSAINKPFYTTDTRAGGNFTYTNKYTSIANKINLPDSSFIKTDTVQFNIFDTWAGISLFPNTELNKLFINTSAAYSRTNYFERPYISADSNFYFHNYNNYLTAITLRKIAYINAVKILGYGTVEAIPTGVNIQLIGGVSKSTFTERVYLGSKIEVAKLVKHTGIFSLKLSAGSYFRNHISEDALTGGRLLYLSPLINIQDFELRNIFTISYTSLLNKKMHSELDFGSGIRNLKQLGVYGNSIMIMRYQPVLFTPFYRAGFKFSITPYTDIGWLCKSEFFNENKEFYSVHGMSLSIKNESFRAPALSLNMAYYPPNAINSERFMIQLLLNDLRFNYLFPSFKPSVISTSDFE